MKNTKYHLFGISVIGISIIGMRIIGMIYSYEETPLTDFSTVKLLLVRLDKQSGSRVTRNSYLKALEMFCQWRHMDPDELIAERKRELQESDVGDQRKAETSIDEWFGVLTSTVSKHTKKVLSRNTCVLRYNGVRSFYKANYVELQVEDAPTGWNEKGKPEITAEHYGQLIQAVSGSTERPMQKAYILCQAQSGLSVSDLLRITLRSSEASIFGDIGTQLETDADHIHLRIFRAKEKQVGHFDSFFGKLATEALRIWIKDAKRRPKFRRAKQRLFPYIPRTINEFLYRASARAKLPWRISSHKLRMYFSTSLKMTRLNDPAFNNDLIEYWMGHSLGRTRGAYMAPPIMRQLELYKAAENRLEPIIDPKFKPRKWERPGRRSTKNRDR